MSVTTIDGLLEAWATQAEAMQANYESIYGPSGITPTLPSVTTKDGMLEAIAKETEKAVKNVAIDNGAYYDITSEAYSVSIPSGIVKWYGVNKLGGKTIVWNQLMYDGDMKDVSQWYAYNSTWYGCSITDSVLTVERLETGTGLANLSLLCHDSPLSIVGHKYYVAATLYGSTALNSARFFAGGVSSATFTITTSPKRFGYVISATQSNQGLNIYVPGTSLTSGKKLYVSNFVAYDLTAMFGAGNEPATAEEVQAILPKEYYEFNPGTLLSAGVTEVVSKDSTDVEVGAIVIPDEVQALEGYGRSAGSIYNYVDFENKKFVQNVGAVDLSTLTWGYGPTVGWSATLNAKNPADDDAVFNGVSDNYTAVSRNTQATAFAGGTDAGMVSVSGGKVYVGTGDIGIVPSGTLYYELDEPVETDISAYLTNTDIDVEAGGSLTFPNQHGDDYHIPVYNEMEYIAV